MVLIMKKSFETYLCVIEAVLECKLFAWQKKILFQLYSGDFKSVNGIGRGVGISTLDTAAILMCDLIDRDANNLHNYRYRLDGYKADILLCDDSARYNIEKENKYGE